MSARTVIVCDRCGVEESMSGRTRDVPPGWSSIAFSVARGGNLHVDLHTQACPPCSEAIALALSADGSAFNAAVAKQKQEDDDAARTRAGSKAAVQIPCIGEIEAAP